MDIKFNSNISNPNYNNFKVSSDLQTKVEKVDSNQDNLKKDSNNSLKMLQDVLNISNSLSKRIAFSIDEETKNIKIRIVNSETNETIREIPSEELQKLHKKMTEALADIGLFIDEKA